MSESKPLWQDILQFSRRKTKMAVGFILIGILGLALPIIPGLLLLTVGVFLIKPGWYESFKRWFEK
jgi:uncharacterized protein YqgC (DUF456 family)